MNERSVNLPAPTVRLRRMTKADVDVLLPHEQVMFGTESWSRNSYLDELADTESRHYLVAVDDNDQVLASAGLLTIAETAQIVTIGVLPAARRRGIARLLVRELLDEARRRQAQEVLLEVRIDNKPARKLYESQGFVPIGTRRGYYDRGRVDAVVMRYAL
ncbi:MAG TPA: ribosomal protein S18-alanine N-acetyltransferase [Jatrophihabitans sp.]|nr:ribosomal protein S18-alanine N-acetyltransferase [Jatrophihabitans sp.]